MSVILEVVVMVSDAGFRNSWGQVEEAEFGMLTDETGDFVHISKSIEL